MKEELDQIDEEKRQLLKDLNLWESKKRENETIEKVTVSMFSTFSMLFSKATVFHDKGPQICCLFAAAHGSELIGKKCYLIKWPHELMCLDFWQTFFNP